MATIRSLAVNALRLDEILSMTEGIAAMAFDIKGLSGCWGGKNTPRQSS
jgi:hypothetical protein